MQTRGKLMKMLGGYLPVKAIVVAVASLALFPLMVSAATVEVWQGDNYFTNVTNGTPKESSDIDALNVTTIEVGDSVKWTNNGTTDHTSVSDDDFDNGLLEGDLWKSPNMGIGDVFTHTFNDEGEFLYICVVHGRDDMAGKIIVEKAAVVTPTPTPTPPTNGKSFTFKCDQPLVDWIGGLEVLEMELGEEVGCVLTLTDPRPDVIVNVLNQAVFFWSAVNVDPMFCVTDENGQCEYTIEGAAAGISWTAWGVSGSDDDNAIEFDKSAYDNGTAWGNVVIVKE